jgi:dihydroorotate dehydrogenase
MLEKLFPLAKPILHAMDAEVAHGLTIKSLKCPMMACKAPRSDIHLNQNIWKINFPSPVGLAAGFDKNGEAIDAMFGLGFGFVEVGTVTPLPQGGNERPRIFRDSGSRSVINRMGFPNLGALALDDRIIKFREKAKNKEGILGVNIGKNKDTEDAASDYLELIDRYAGIADYLTVNISSPNTPGLRDLQEPENLKPFLQQLVAKRDEMEGIKTPLLVKLAPDLEAHDILAIAEVIKETKIDGLILTNTTKARPESLPQEFRSLQGGLSGPHLKEQSKVIISAFYRVTEGQVPIIGVGGVDSAQDAYAKIRSGASLVQLYTALVYHGPQLVKDINQGLLALAQKDGFNTISEAVGADFK